MVFLSFDSKIHVILSKMGGVWPASSWLIEKEWLLNCLHYLFSHGKKKLLRFQTLGFCRSNFREQSPTTYERVRLVLRLFLLR